MAENRTSVAVSPTLKRRIKKLAGEAKPKMGWTIQLVLLAEEALDRREAAK